MKPVKGVKTFMRVLTVTLNPALDRELILPNFAINRLHRLRNPSDSVMTPGGKGINVSMILDSMGISNVAMGILAGYVGRIVEEELRRLHPDITLNFVYTDGETRENITVIDPMNDTITEINSPGPLVSERELEIFYRRYLMTLPRVEMVVISGSAPPGVDEGYCLKLVRAAKSKGKVVFMESIGPFFDRVLQEDCPQVVRADLRREKRVLGRELKEFQDYVELAKEIRQLGAKAVVLSYKIVSDVVATEEGVWKFTIKDHVEVSHLLGTGDAFVAGMVYAVLKGLSYYEVLKYGMAAAIAEIRHLRKSELSIEDMERELQSFDIERIE